MSQKKTELTRLQATTIPGKPDVCMVAIAQLAEHLVVAQEAVGSSPTGHPPEWLKAQIRKSMRIAGFFVLRGSFLTRKKRAA